MINQGFEGWGKANQVRNTMEKMFEINWKKWIIA
jgi:hypothetical protein